MENTFNWFFNQKARSEETKVSTTFFSEAEGERAEAFHKSLPQYQPTPLHNLKNLANYLGISSFTVKDESFRFGLNAFKALGGSYAIGRYLSSRLGINPDELSYKKLLTTSAKSHLGEITFATATDGNHGRGVAWAAQQLGQKAVVYMPKGSSIHRLNNIRATGAQASITNYNYDDTVRLAAENAKRFGWEIIQDTSWPGYEEIPLLVMQGYLTMANETIAQLNLLEIVPTHIFIQSGNGSLPGALQGFLAAKYKQNRPIVTIVEPTKADCVLKSAQANDGSPRKVCGPMNTIMAGLACGEPNPFAWNIMRDYTDAFLACPDYAAALGMRILGNPIEADARVISGESGAVTTGVLSLIMQKDNLKPVRKFLNLNENSRVLVFSTEGDTDPDHYRKIVWEGFHPTPK